VDQRVRALDTTEGDIAALLDRIAGIRTWTYVSHRPGWLADPLTWQARTREIEDRLADALHARLREEYANPGATLIARHEGATVASQLAEDGTLLLQGVTAGRLIGFEFEPLPGPASHALRAAANRVLRANIGARVEELVESADDAFALTGPGAILWRGARVGRLLPGDRLIAPLAEALATDLLDPPRRERVRRRLADFASAHIRLALAPLFAALEADATGSVRGLLYRLTQSLGSAPRRTLRVAIEALTQPDRRELARLGVVLGRRHVFMPSLLRVRALLFQVRHKIAAPLPSGPLSLRGGVSHDPQRDAACGYEALSNLMVRVDAIENLLGAAHAQARQGPFPPNPSLARLLQCGPEDLPAILISLGFEKTDHGFRARDPRAGRKPGRR
jgi:ATP-dependent RNA helicase SUPV3L1/SUV3